MFYEALYLEPYIKNFIPYKLLVFKPSLSFHNLSLDTYLPIIKFYYVIQI
jgi:hypothetical protein